MKRILIACEFSGIIRDAFIERGFDAWSCDLEPSEQPGNHIQGDVRSILDDDWDLIIAHPPCTYFAVSGNRWFNDERYEDRFVKRQEALDFFLLFVHNKCVNIAIENPKGTISTLYRKPDQIIHPWWFGDPVAKGTCLWLKGLPKLIPTNIVNVEYVTMSNGKRFSKWEYEISKLPYKQRPIARSRTFKGIAKAMASQWGNYLINEEK